MSVGYLRVNHRTILDQIFLDGDEMQNALGKVLSTTYSAIRRPINNHYENNIQDIIFHITQIEGCSVITQSTEINKLLSKCSSRSVLNIIKSNLLNTNIPHKNNDIIILCNDSSRIAIVVKDDQSYKLLYYKNIFDLSDILHEEKLIDQAFKKISETIYIENSEQDYIHDSVHEDQVMIKYDLKIDPVKQFPEVSDGYKLTSRDYKVLRHLISSILSKIINNKV